MTQEEYKDEARRLRPRLLEVARRYLGDEDAEDTVQDALLRLWQMLDQLHLPLDALASVLVRNLCVDRLRRRQPLAPLDDRVSVDGVSQADTDERIDLGGLTDALGDAADAARDVAEDGCHG